jgi:hypothetical protein
VSQRLAQARPTDSQFREHAAGKGQHEAIEQGMVKPNTPPVDLLHAGMAIGTIQPAS